jgi:hypothetical protein
MDEDKPDGNITATTNINIGVAETYQTVALKRKQLTLAKSHYKKALQIYTLIHGPRHPNTTNIVFQLTAVSRELSLPNLVV